MPGKHHLRGFKIAPTMVSIALVDARKTSLTGVQNSKKIGSPLRGSWTMVSIALEDARKTSLTGVQNSKKIGSPLRGSWTMVSIALVDARKTSLMGVQNSKKIGSPLRGSWTMLRIVVGSWKPPPPWKKARSAPDDYKNYENFTCWVWCQWVTRIHISDLLNTPPYTICTLNQRQW